MKFILFLFLSLNVFAQQDNLKIKGNIIDRKENKITSAEIYLFTTNNELVKTTISQDGNFEFLIQLADVGKTTLVSGFNDKHGDKIYKGNLVFWGFVESVNDINALKISGIGHVLAILSPEYDQNQGKWIIKKDLTK